MRNTTIMQFKNYDPKKLKYPMLGQVKKDGIFGRWCSVSQKFFTRSNNAIQGLEVLENEMRHMPDMDGELLIPSMPFFESSGLIRSFNSTPDCKYYVFDMPMSSVTTCHRIMHYTDILTDANLTHVEALPAQVLKNQQDIDEYFENVLSLGEEGVVYKNADACYYNGKKYFCMKRVPAKTVECKIIGFQEGTKSFTNMLGAFLVNYKGHEVKVGNGPEMTHAFRMEVWNDPDKYIGRMLTVEYKSKTTKGSLRSPKYKGIRWDI